MFWNGLCFLMGLWLVPAQVNGQCSVNIRNDINVKDPVYLTSIGQLWAPIGASLEWVSGQDSFLTCSGSSNFLTLNDEVTSTMSCSSGTTFLVDGVLANSTDLACANTITGDYVNTGSSCGGGGTLINLGFQTETFGFVTYIQSCYSMTTGSTLYTRHEIPGYAIDYSVIEPNTPNFKSSGTAPHVNPAISYKQASQLTRLTTLLGSQAQAEIYLSTNSFLARGHLAPDGDGIFRSWQFTTYFYINAAPEWQVVNAGNWIRVENAARKKASALQADVLIFTGTYGILTLPNVNGNQVEITLEAGGNIEVPKWFWKIIKNPATNAGIALVTLNNPFVTSIGINEYLCDDICASSGWLSSHYSDFSKGFTYCCAVNDLMASISFIPSEASSSSILQF